MRTYESAIRRRFRSSCERKVDPRTGACRRLNLPLIAKDTVKDALMSVLPVPDVGTSRQIGRAAVEAMLAVAAESPPGAVLESNFYRSIAAERLSRLPGQIVEVFCRCCAAVAAQRYRARAGTRHAGHFDSLRTPEELWNEEVAEPVAGGWPLLEVDTAFRSAVPGWTSAHRLRTL